MAIYLKNEMEVPSENMHMACRDKHSNRIREGLCIVCNDKDGWGHACGDLPRTGYPRKN